MDRARFDALARLLATTGSRRGAVSALVSVALLGQNPDALADRPRGHGQDQGDRPEGSEGQGGQPDLTSPSSRGSAERRSGKSRPRRGEGNGPDRQQPATAQAAPPSCFYDKPCVPGPRADLQRCDFTDANTLKNATCTGCNLQGASLLRADATGADLTRANLSRACLVDANLTDAIFSNTNSRGAIYCRTIMPNGSINNSGCGKGTSCCPVCITIGETCGPGIAGSCCGGATCRNGRCACPADKPIDCNGVCRQCCDDGNCSSSAPKCCSGVCRQCCQPRDCPERVCRTADCTAQGTCNYTVVPDNRSGPRCLSPRVCCDGGCCDAGQVCDTRGGATVCCTPESRETTCNPPGRLPRCGMTPNNCGDPVACGPCEEVVCNTGACTNRLHICQYTPVPDLTKCDTQTIDKGICCDGGCVAGNCCGTANCNRTANRCMNNTCRCGSGAACTFPNPTCCGASPGGACVDTERDVNNCGRCGNRCSRNRVCADDPPRCCQPPGTTCTYLFGLQRNCCSSNCRPFPFAPIGIGTCH